VKAFDSGLHYLFKEWLLILALAGLLLSSLWLQRLPAYSADELQVLFLLWLLFASVKELQLSGLAAWLAGLLERGAYLPEKLVLAAFVLAALVSNDVALMMVVPLTLLLNSNRKGALVMLEAFAANAGSALTPFGNPQNLYLYWHYGLQPLEFITAIAPFALAYLLIMLLAASRLKTAAKAKGERAQPPKLRQVAPGLVLLLLLVAIVLRWLPFNLAYIAAAALLVRRRSLSKVDYGLLLTFLVFFGLVDNVKQALAVSLAHNGRVFLNAALLSQIISNVPAAILLAEFTHRWRALLWGVSVGGYGSLVASMANVIAWRFYVASQPDAVKRRRFTLLFNVYGFTLLAFGVGLYLLCMG